MSDPAIVYILILVVASIALLAIALGVAYWFLFIKYKQIKEEVLLRQKNEALLYQKTIDSAKKQSLQILDAAQSAAHSFVSQARNISTANTQEIAKLLESNLQEQRTSYQSVLSESLRSTQQSLHALPDDVRKQVISEVQKITQELTSEMKTIHDSVREVLKEPYQKAEIEAKQYKEVKMKEFNDKLFSLLQSISKEVLRKELTIEQHEKLVVKSIEQFKNEGGLS